MTLIAIDTITDVRDKTTVNLKVNAGCLIMPGNKADDYALYIRLCKEHALQTSHHC